ncbi:MAG: tRNA (adenosine(37)-N6)-threonylcarbamoyltransferase complex dimerization subunit type 1 TsaB [Longimicrobiales bacterium]|nr:tRNA (adenosine(37)-N6)-threonylcarbamoyltransferase complex dimerization subunit type 1 TsaB [Longimicrobiales bacterium]
MISLAFDTSSSLGSVALGDGEGGVLARRFLRERGAHASGLIPAIRDVLQDAGVARSSVERVVVGAGPGSFTGLRVAAATAKGLVRSLEIPLWAVSSLAAGAVTDRLRIPGLDPPTTELRDMELPRFVLFDARSDRIYGACYRITNGGLEVLRAPFPGRLEEVLRSDLPRGVLFCGGGARRHQDRVEAAGFRVLPAPAGIPTADALLRVVALDGDGGGTIEEVESPGRWEPQYLRAWKPDRERRAG